MQVSPRQPRPKDVGLSGTRIGLEVDSSSSRGPRPGNTSEPKTAKTEGCGISRGQMTGA